MCPAHATRLQRGRRRHSTGRGQRLAGSGESASSACSRGASLLPRTPTRRRSTCTCGRPTRALTLAPPTLAPPDLHFRNPRLGQSPSISVNLGQSESISFNLSQSRPVSRAAPRRAVCSAVQKQAVGRRRDEGGVRSGSRRKRHWPVAQPALREKRPAPRRRVKVPQVVERGGRGAAARLAAPRAAEDEEAAPVRRRAYRHSLA